MQSILQMLYPAQCMSCNSFVEDHMGLCGECWRQTPFINGPSCSSCGIALSGEVGSNGAQCNDCLHIARPWRRGVAALMYRDHGRTLTLRLKHGDRTELARPAAKWIAARLGKIDPETLIVPVPLHWQRLLKRRYNQAALIAANLAQETGCAYRSNALIRPYATLPLDGITRDARFERLQNAIAPHPRHGNHLEGRKLLLVDDVMTSGATLASCTEACFAAGAAQVDIAVLARVAKDDYI